MAIIEALIDKCIILGMSKRLMNKLDAVRWDLKPCR